MVIAVSLYHVHSLLSTWRPGRQSVLTLPESAHLQRGNLCAQVASEGTNGPAERGVFNNNFSRGLLPLLDLLVDFFVLSSNFDGAFTTDAVRCPAFNLVLFTTARARRFAALKGLWMSTNSSSKQPSVPTNSNDWDFLDANRHNWTLLWTRQPYGTVHVLSFLETALCVDAQPLQSQRILWAQVACESAGRSSQLSYDHSERNLLYRAFHRVSSGLDIKNNILILSAPVISKRKRRCS